MYYEYIFTSVYDCHSGVSMQSFERDTILVYDSNVNVEKHLFHVCTLHQMIFKFKFKFKLKTK